MEGNKEKKVTIDFEPYKPLNTFLYMCDSKFHVEALEELMVSDQSYGFIIVDGNGCLYGVLSGNNKEILQEFSVLLPKKHNKGRQSALRFSRLRLEKRHNYTMKVSELAVKHFIKDDKVTVNGIVLAGSADFKNQLVSKDFLDQRLQEKIINIVDIAYGGLNGFKQAIDMSQDSLGNLKFIKEKKLLQEYFDNIELDNGLYCFGISHLMYALESGAVSKLIIYEDLDLNRYMLRDNDNNEEIVYSKELTEENNDKEIISCELLTDWFTENYRNFGANLFYVSDATAIGQQYKAGFGGIGGILRFPCTQYESEASISDYDEDEDFFI